MSLEAHLSFQWAWRTHARHLGDHTRLSQAGPGGKSRCSDDRRRRLKPSFRRGASENARGSCRRWWFRRHFPISWLSLLLSLLPVLLSLSSRISGITSFCHTIRKQATDLTWSLLAISGVVVTRLQRLSSTAALALAAVAVNGAAVHKGVWRMQLSINPAVI